MAFVNKASGEENQEATGTSGQPIDFDPFDPDVVKVHYDMSVWTFDQRAELSEALADAEFPHYWDGDELIVPEAIEADVDALFERLEALFGPFPMILQDDADSTEFGLDEWTDADRKVLTEALIDAKIPHRWDGTTVIVAVDAEHAVDDLLNAIMAFPAAAAGFDVIGHVLDAGLHRIRRSQESGHPARVRVRRRRQRLLRLGRAAI